jgi:hypothetical protein
VVGTGKNAPAAYCVEPLPRAPVANEAKVAMVPSTSLRQAGGGGVGGEGHGRTLASQGTSAHPAPLQVPVGVGGGEVRGQRTWWLAARQAALCVQRVVRGHKGRRRAAFVAQRHRFSKGLCYSNIMQ